MPRALLTLLLLGVLAVKKSTASSYGYFLDSSCTTAESLVLEDFCVETPKCERVSYTANGVKFPGTVYKTPVCAQNDEAIQALFPKGTKLFVNAKFKERNCSGSAFTTPTSVYIADSKCHQNGYNHGYRVEIESSGDVVVHTYLEHDCSGLDTSGVYDRTRKENIGVCRALSSKDYFLTGTREATGSSQSTTATVTASNTTTDTPSSSTKSNATADSPSTSAPTSMTVNHAVVSDIVAFVVCASIGWISVVQEGPYA